MGSLDRLKDISGFMADLPLDDTLGSATTRAIGGMLGTIALEIEREREQSAEFGSYADAAEWVEQHGGLDAVIERWAGSVPSAHVKRIVAGWKEKRSRLAAHARRLEHLVGERRRQIKRLNSEIESMRPRLMPEGCEWPRHESGDPVRIGDEFIDHEGLLRKVERIVFTGDGYLLVSKKGTYCLRRYGEPVKRPAFLAADGEPLEVGQTVWDADGDEFRVLGLYGGPVDGDFPDHTVRCRRAGAEDYEITMCAPSQLTHQRPVLDADGNRIETGMDVWWVCEGDERGIHAEMLHVDGIDGDGMVECSPYNGGTSVVLDPAELYVKKPVLDANGVPIREGDTVWCVGGGEAAEVAYTITADASHPDEVVLKGYEDDWPVNADKLTHTKPEPLDSWERWRSDLESDALGYAQDAYHGLETSIDFDGFVRRARALAERGE